MLAVLLLSPAAAHAQRASLLTPSWQEAITARDLEIYLRVAQLAGAAPMAPWTIRGFSPEAIDARAPGDSMSPWSGRFQRASAPRGIRVLVFSPDLTVVGTSGYPVLGTVDGAVWTGRGLTTIVTGGVQIRAPHLSITLRPVAFRAENARWTEAPVAVGAPSPHGDAPWGCCIDLPQRFGDRAYTRVDPGESTVRVSAGPLALGMSSATQAWGPSDENPLVLGAGAAGIPHVFVETAHPLSVGIGHIQGRLIAGRPGDSMVPTDSGRPRKIAGAVFGFSPHHATGLEIGVSRFFHERLAPDGLRARDLLLPFTGLFETSAAPSESDDPTKPNYRPTNELASVFFRWASSSTHAEIWGEYLKNDHPLNRRDLLVEPDHDAAWSLGARKLLSASARRIIALRGEFVSAGVSHLDRVRSQTPMYIHFPVTAGHTQLGQLLGSTAANGGGGLSIRLDAYTARGLSSFGLVRFVRQTTPLLEGPPPSGYDVVYRATADRTLFRSTLDLAFGALAEYELNRDFRRDVPNVELRVTVRPRRRNAARSSVSVAPPPPQR